jgi:hypothetical protein
VLTLNIPLLGFGKTTEVKILLLSIASFAGLLPFTGINAQV